MCETDREAERKRQRQRRQKEAEETGRETKRHRDESHCHQLFGTPSALSPSLHTLTQLPLWPVLVLCHLLLLPIAPWASLLSSNTQEGCSFPQTHKKAFAHTLPTILMLALCLSLCLPLSSDLALGEPQAPSLSPFLACFPWLPRHSADAPAFCISPLLSCTQCVSNSIWNAVGAQ